MRFGIDYAWGGPPSLASLHENGVSFVGRYFSEDASKNINATEYANLSRGGIEVKTFWETVADRALAGGQAGWSDAVNASSQRRRCGMPDWQVVYLSVDFEATGPDVHDYFSGARSVLGRATGGYGGYAAIKYLFDENLIEQGWQTAAWSEGRWDARAKVRQYSNGHAIGGVQCDYNAALTEGPPVNPLDVLLEPERDTADSFLAYRRNPREHPHGLKVTLEELIRFRKAIWVAAERGRLPNGQTTERGWNVLHRNARYRVLWGLTGGG